MSIKSVDILISFTFMLFTLIYMRNNDFFKNNSLIVSSKNEFKNQILKTIYTNRYVLIIIPVVFFFISNTIQFSNFLKYKDLFPEKINNNIEFKSVVELYNLKNVLIYLILNLDDNVYRIVSLFKYLNFASIVFIPFIMFYKIKSRKGNFFKRILISILFISIVVLIKYFSNFEYKTRLIINILGDITGIFTIYFSSFLICYIYKIINNGYKGKENSLLKDLEQVDDQASNVFFVMVIRHIIISISYFIIKYTNVEFELNYLTTIINLVINIMFLVVLPVMINENYTLNEAIKVTKNLIKENLFSIIRIIIIYTSIYFFIFYFKQSILMNNYILNNLLSFVILFPVYIYSFIHFNFYIIKLVNVHLLDDKKNGYTT